MPHGSSFKTGRMAPVETGCCFFVLVRTGKTNLQALCPDWWECPRPLAEYSTRTIRPSVSIHDSNTTTSRHFVSPQAPRLRPFQALSVQGGRAKTSKTAWHRRQVWPSGRSSGESPTPKRWSPPAKFKASCGPKKSSRNGGRNQLFGKIALLAAIQKLSKCNKSDRVWMNFGNTFEQTYRRASRL